MSTHKFLIIASIQATKIKSELEDKLKNLPGKWDVLNLDGTLTSITNKDTDENILNENVIKLAYIKTIKDSHRDNRTFLQVDSMEVYIKYNLLKNPYLYVGNANNFTNYEMAFNINDLNEELGISKKNILYTVKL